MSGRSPPPESQRRRASPAGVACITVSVRSAIPRRVAPQQSPLPLHRRRHYSSIVHSGITRMPANLLPVPCLTHGVQSMERSERVSES
jgi:hypothetical protein